MWNIDVSKYFTAALALSWHICTDAIKSNKRCNKIYFSMRLFYYTCGRRNRRRPVTISFAARCNILVYSWSHAHICIHLLRIILLINVLFHSYLLKQQAAAYYQVKKATGIVYCKLQVWFLSDSEIKSVSNYYCGLWNESKIQTNKYNINSFRNRPVWQRPTAKTNKWRRNNIGYS